MTAPLRTLTAARTNRGQMFVCLLPATDRIAGDTDIMVPIKAIRERDPFMVPYLEREITYNHVNAVPIWDGLMVDIDAEH